MFKILKKLYLVSILKPKGIYHLICSALLYGANLMVLIRFSAKLYPNKIAIAEENETLSYTDLYLQSKQLIIAFKRKFNLGAGRKVAVLCRNHASLVRTLFAVSGAGADLYLLNVEITTDQLSTLCDQYQFDLIIFDHEVSALVNSVFYGHKAILSSLPSLPSIHFLSEKTPVSAHDKFRKNKAGKIIVLTGGTTGNFKTAARQPSFLNFFNCLSALGEWFFRGYYVVERHWSCYHCLLNHPIE